EILHTLEQLCAYMLSIAALDPSTVPFQRRPVALSELAERTATHFQSSAQVKGIAIRLQLPTSIAVPLIEGDPTLLEHLLSNLVGNSIKHTPSGGSVTLCLIPEGGVVHLEVTDTGIGMGTENIQAALSGSGRPSGQPTAGEDSTGTGLSVIWHIVKAHRAHLAIFSEGRGKGTTFRITFPAVKDIPSIPVSQQ
ncbi:MAG: ATP-binding protein, partial [Bacteroidota bacterium]|nr:ATP-binding protein [Bacteroidota bacterium]